MSSRPGAVPVHVVDAFTDRPFAGNPAAVCLLGRAAPAEWMASVAAEINLSETAFVWREADTWRLRWWTPAAEVPLCGHATLAAAHVLRSEGLVGHDESVAFETASGTLHACPDGPRIELDLPAYERQEVGAADRAAVEAAVVAPVVDVARYGPKLLAAVADEEGVDAGVAAIGAVARLPAEGLALTADRPGGYVLRYFAPAVGVDEDPVTGSAQCATGPYWHERNGDEEWEVDQRSPRGGHLWVRLSTQGRVKVAGQAVTVSRGELLVAPG